MNRQVFVGPLVQTDENGELVIIERVGIHVEGGKIVHIDNSPDTPKTQDHLYTILEDGQFIIPGFIDCHIHAVQLPNIGTGYDKDLLDWLESYTFPLERKFCDEQFSAKVFEAVVKRTLSVGTTTACYFASLYGKSSNILAKIAAKYQQRAFVGKVNMDCVRQDNYYESTSDSIKNTKEFVQDVLGINDPLVKPIITPRFALSCSMELMEELAQIAKDYKLHIQTHVSENQLEIETCKQLFPDCPTYVDVYRKAGLLTNKTILAHGVHLEDSELKLLKEHGTSVIHCPSSNTCLKSGLCDVQRLRSQGVTVGLGTDVAGGQSVCILDAIRSALQVSNHLSMMNPGSYKAMDYVDAFHLATLGGAKALAIDSEVGNLVVGKQFDALVIDVNTPDGPLDNLADYTLKEQLQRFIYSGDDRNIVKVYVAGHNVK